VGTALRSTPIACAECHTQPTTMNHANGTVGMVWGALSRTGGLSPTWSGTSCSNTYCHGSSLTASGGTNKVPSWTGGAAQAACGTCHGNPPPAPHVQNTACGTCHAGYTSTTVNGAVHIDGVLNVVTQTCSTCHGSATNAAPPAGTRGETLTTTRAVGAHQAHLVNTTLRSAAIACAECHTVPTAMNHASGTVEMARGTLTRTGGFAPTWTGTTCTNYCHGSSLAAGGTITAPSWTGGATQDACGTCHGVTPPAPHSTSTACGSCHAGYTSTTVNLALHIDGKLDATSYHPSGWAAANQHGYQANLTGLAGCKSCHGANLDGVGGSTSVSCTACHTTAGFANWATNCTFCHGNPTSGRQSPPVDIQGRSVTTNVSVGKHDRHVAPAMMSPIACTECHAARTTSVITDTAHVDGNGIAEVVLGALSRTGGAAATYTRTSATSATCASNYCHGSFTGGTTTTPNWASGAAMTCASCHRSPPQTGEHDKHMGKSSFNCSHCHNGIATGTGRTSTNAAIVNPASHVNGVKNVVFGGTYNRRTVTGSWNATTRTCTVSCHGSETW
jgi:predicted CxxxxCH...CXXCH cytochrome family protein